MDMYIIIDEFKYYHLWFRLLKARYIKTTHFIANVR